MDSQNIPKIVDYKLKSISTPPPSRKCSDTNIDKVDNALFANELAKTLTQTFETNNKNDTMINEEQSHHAQTVTIEDFQKSNNIESLNIGQMKGIFLN